MARELEIYKETRLVGVRFARAISGDPHVEYPDVDDRGHNSKVPGMDGGAESNEIRGPAVGITKGKKIKLKLIRESIDNSAPLYLTSSDETVAKIVDPAAGAALPGQREAIVEIEGQHFAAAKPKEVKIEVRFESVDGPVIYTLTAFVFSPLPVFIQPHLVTINNAAGSGGTAPTLDLDGVMKQVQALWAPAGIRFVIQPTKSWAVNLPSANVMRWQDVNTVLAQRWQANAINVYVVKEIAGALGYGFSKAAHAGFGISKPSAFAGSKEGGSVRGNGDSYWWANDIAHELGHFFTLWHPSDDPEDGSPWTRWETWSMRFLMHNYNFTHRGNPPGDAADWPDYNDFGYGKHGSGNPFRAGLVPLKNVRTGAGAGRDGQVAAVRNHILQGPASLY